MRATVLVEIEPFYAPDYVCVSNMSLANVVETTAPKPTIPLSALDSDALWALCDEFRAAVFRKAGKELPPDPQPMCC